jgi:hypothetical protein
MWTKGDQLLGGLLHRYSFRCTLNQLLLSHIMCTAHHSLIRDFPLAHVLANFDRFRYCVKVFLIIGNTLHTIVVYFLLVFITRNFGK